MGSFFVANMKVQITPSLAKGQKPKVQSYQTAPEAATVARKPAQLFNFHQRKKGNNAA